LPHKTIQEIDAQSRTLAIKGRHKTAIRMLRKHLEGGKIVDDGTVLIQLAFMLYHDALKDYWSQTASERRRKEVKEEMKEATDILEKIIPKMKKAGDIKKMLSPRIFLAQIYASTGDARAVRIARENFRLSKEAVMANRLADVYCRLGKKQDSLRWHQTYAVLAQKENVPSYEIKMNMAIAYFSLDKPELGNKIAREIINRFPKTLKGQSMRKILKGYFNTKAGSNSN